MSRDQNNHYFEKLQTLLAEFLKIAPCTRTGYLISSNIFASTYVTKTYLGCKNYCMKILALDKPNFSRNLNSW